MTLLAVTPDHWSYSQWADFSGCGHRYKLKRLDLVPEVPGVAAVAGKAWHKWSEWYDTGGKTERGEAADNFDQSWYQALDVAVEAEIEESGVPVEEWRVSGRASKRAPNREDLTYWREYGLDLCVSYVYWSATTPWTIAKDLPPDDQDNTWGVEYGVSTLLGGEPFVGYLDRISRDEYGNLGVVDYKTGSQMRHTIQLGMYAAAAEQKGIRLHWGAFYNARKGESTEPVSLLGWTPERVAEIMAPQQFMRDNGIFPIRPGDHCDYCPVRKACQFHF